MQNFDDLSFNFASGTSEAFLHAVATEDQLKRSNDSLLVFSVIYIVMNVILIQSAGSVGLILANSLSILLHCHCQPRHNLFLYLWYSYRIQLKLSEGYKCKKDFYDFESESLSPFLQMRSMWLIICEVLKSAFSCCILSFLTAVKI